MDTFELLMEEVSQAAQGDDVSFEDALVSALSDSSPAVDTNSPSAEPDEESLDAQDVLPIRNHLTTVGDLITAMKSLVPVQINAVLSKDGWTQTGDEITPCAYRFEGSFFASCMRTDMFVSMASSDAAAKAGIYPVTDTQNGYVQILAAEVPEDDLAVRFDVFVVSTGLGN